MSWNRHRSTRKLRWKRHQSLRKRHSFTIRDNQQLLTTSKLNKMTGRLMSTLVTSTASPLLIRKSFRIVILLSLCKERCVATGKMSSFSAKQYLKCLENPSDFAGTSRALTSSNCNKSFLLSGRRRI